MESMDMKAFSARFAVAPLARRAHIKITYFAAPEVAFEERLQNWQHASNAVCLERLVGVIGDGGSGVRRLANAWSVGDIGALRQLVPAFSFSRGRPRITNCGVRKRG